MYYSKRSLDALRTFLDAKIVDIRSALLIGDSEAYNRRVDYLYGAVAALEVVGIKVRLYPVYAGDTTFTYSLEVV